MTCHLRMETSKIMHLQLCQIEPTQLREESALQISV